MTKQYQRAYLSVNPSAINMPPKRVLYLEIIHTEFLNVKHITLLIFLKKWFSDIIECLK